MFTAVLALVLFVADFALAMLFDRMYQRMQTGQTGGEINRYLAFAKPPNLLIMGDSRARYQVIPDSFAVPAFSLCHAGMGQVFQTGLLEVLVQEKKMPRNILLHVDFQDYVGKDDLEDAGNLRYYYNKIPVVTAAVNQISQYERIKYLFNLYRYNGRVISTVKNYLQSRSNPSLGSGYQSIGTASYDSTSFVSASTSQTTMQRRNLRHLQRFISVCHQNNINLLCFTSPYFSKPNYSTTVGAPIDSLLKAQKVPYLNTVEQTLPILKQHATYWLDNDHLNELGAVHLSHQIAQWSKHYLFSTTAVKE